MLANVHWEAVHAISSVFETIAVTLTLVYLVIEIRRSTGATHSQTYQSATQALAEMAAIVGENKEKARIFVTGMSDPKQLDKDEYLQFAYLGISLFRRYENVFFQYQAGFIDDDFWLGHRDNLLWFFHRPGMQSWWEERQLGFSLSFRKFLDSTSPDDVIAPKTRHV